MDMRKPPQELIDAFFQWLEKDPHRNKEDYYRDTITLDRLSNLSEADFIEFFYTFAHDGGQVQSGGYRTSGSFRETMTENYTRFRNFVMEPFQSNFNEAVWLKGIDGFKYFGIGLATIYLNRVDKSRFPILNNKSLDALRLFGVSLQTDNVKRYQALREAHQQLIQWHPRFDNFFKTDALAQFLIGEEAGREWKEKLETMQRESMQTPTRGHVVSPSTSLPSKNVILYGPPGTGKTYTLKNTYMKHFTEEVAALSKEDLAAELVADLAWWQVITLVMLDLKKAKVSGILKHPLMQARIRRSNNRTPRAAIWAHIQMHTKIDCENVKYTKRHEPLLFWKDDTSDWSIDMDLTAEEVPELVEMLERYRGHTNAQGAVVERFAFTTFHQSFSYEDFVEGIKPVMSEEVADALAYEVKPGIFKTMVQRALADPGHDYALLIDEISRGNVASIFGELIALIEDDKRKGAPNELRAHLPYSREEFVIPDNLYIIGAMNTADRSVEALDTALRRRFTFIQIPPEPGLIQQPTGLKVNLQALLTTMNARIEKILDKDHCIGHSYFMGIAQHDDPLEGLQKVFAQKILPLLEEYFYGNPAKIGMVLGTRFVKREDAGVTMAEGDWGIDDFEDRKVYRIADPMTLDAEDFRSIYE